MFREARSFGAVDGLLRLANTQTGAARKTSFFFIGRSTGFLGDALAIVVFVMVSKILFSLDFFPLNNQRLIELLLEEFPMLSR